MIFRYWSKTNLGTVHKSLFYFLRRRRLAPPPLTRPSRVIAIFSWRIYDR